MPAFGVSIMSRILLRAVWSLRERRSLNAESENLHRDWLAETKSKVIKPEPAPGHCRVVVV